MMNDVLSREKRKSEKICKSAKPLKDLEGKESRKTRVNESLCNIIFPFCVTASA